MRSIEPLSQLGLSLLACPVCGSELDSSCKGLSCRNTDCGSQFQVSGEVPIMTKDVNGRTKDSEKDVLVETGATQTGFLKTLVKSITPGRSLNLVSSKNYKRLFRKLKTEFDNPKILILGGGELGTGLDNLDEYVDLSVLETDIYIGNRTKLVCDAQFLPFKDRTFNAVIIQAVLEYISDTDKCIDQIYRVLSNDGLVYSETPFMQQSQAFPDLKRFTLLGHNQAFYRFCEIGSGPVAGQGTVLYWAWEFFLCGFAKGEKNRSILRRIARFTGFWLKYFDYYFISKNTANESASAYYFMGVKKDEFQPPESKAAFLDGVDNL